MSVPRLLALRAVRDLANDAYLRGPFRPGEAHGPAWDARDVWPYRDLADYLDPVLRREPWPIIAARAWCEHNP